MSRVDDSDNQRIREMQEAEYRQKVDREKRDQETRVGKAFNEVMSQRSRGELNKQATQNKKSTETQQTESQRVLDQVRGQELKKKEPAELARHAALSRAAQKALLKNRSVDGQAARVDNEQRTEELTTKGQDDSERIEKEIDREEDLEVIRTEEQQAEKKLDGEQPDRIDRDGRNQHQQHGRESEKEKAEGVAAAEAARAPHAPVIPPDLIEKIVGKLFQAINPDGRTSLQLDLKGEGLEGVTLKIASENGRVSCTFEGCNQELKAALRNGKPALTRGLAKRGMKLVALRIS